MLATSVTLRIGQKFGFWRGFTIPERYDLRAYGLRNDTWRARDTVFMGCIDRAA